MAVSHILCNRELVPIWWHSDFLSQVNDRETFSGVDCGGSSCSPTVPWSRDWDPSEPLGPDSSTITQSGRKAGAHTACTPALLTQLSSLRWKSPCQM